MPLIREACRAQYTYPPPSVNPVDLVRDHVLRLTYTAHDMAPFARDLGYDGELTGIPKPLFLMKLVDYGVDAFQLT